MHEDELKNLSYQRIAETEYNRIKKAKSDKGKIGLPTRTEAAQMEVLTKIRRQFNQMLDKLIK